MTCDGMPQTTRLKCRDTRLQNRTWRQCAQEIEAAQVTQLLGNRPTQLITGERSAAERRKGCAALTLREGQSRELLRHISKSGTCECDNVAHNVSRLVKLLSSMGIVPISWLLSRYLHKGKEHSTATQDF